MSSLEEDMELLSDEDLASVDMSLPHKQMIDIYAGERIRQVAAYHSHVSRKKVCEQSAAANESAIGNKQAAEGYKTEVKNLQEQILFCLRYVRLIDTECPDAKARMDQMVK